MFIQFPTLFAFALAIPLMVATAAAAESAAPDSPNASDSVVSAPVNRTPEAAAVTPPAARLARPPQAQDKEVPYSQLTPSPWIIDPPRSIRRPYKEVRNSSVTTLIAGGINSTIGVGLLAGSAALLSQNTHCNLGGSSGSSGCGNALFGWTFLGFGGTHLLVGSILLIVGGATYPSSAE